MRDDTTQGFVTQMNPPRPPTAAASHLILIGVINGAQRLRQREQCRDCLAMFLIHRHGPCICEYQIGRKRANDARLEAAAQRGIERKAMEFWHGEPEGDDAEVGVYSHERSSGDMRGAVGLAQQLVVARGADEETPVIQRHFAVFEEVVEGGQHVALRLHRKGKCVPHVCVCVCVCACVSMCVYVCVCAHAPFCGD